jgi:hypothetical protein
VTRPWPELSLFRGAPFVRHRVSWILVGLLVTLPTLAVGQIPSADAGALALGGPSPTLARGFAAIASNPANLGTQDSPSWSVTALAVEFRNGLDPVSLGDVAAWEGRDVPKSVRTEWLDDVRNERSEAGAVGVDLTFLAYSRGRIGVQLSTRAFGSVALNEDAVELLLFGNAGLTGEPRDFQLSGSAGDGFIVSTGSVAYGRPLAIVGGGLLHVGTTVSFSIGHALWLARDNGSGLTGDPTELDLRFPFLRVARGAATPGQGFGVDVGALWTRGPLAIGATLRNALTTFAWNLDDFVLRPGTAFFDPDRTVTDFDDRPGRAAPPVLLDALEDMTFPRVLAAGAAYRMRPDLTLSADVAVSPGGGMAVESDVRVGIGAEFLPRTNVPLRGGIAVLERGVQLSTGAGLVSGRLTASISAALRTGALDDAVLASLGVAFRPR